MSKAVAIKSQVQTVQHALEAMKGQLAMALPRHITPERMVRVALTAIQNTPKLLECDRNSFYMAVLRSAQLGLEPDGVLGQAYLIPYGSTVQLIPGYKGLIDLARRSGEVSNIIAKEVCENDEFDVDYSQETPFVHKPKLSGDRGEVILFWAMARFKDGGLHWDYMTKNEIIAIRDNSSGWKQAVAWSNNPKNTKSRGQILSPWEQNFIEMGKKTVIRRIAKYLPMSVQRAAVVEDLVDSGKKFSVDNFGEIIIDGNAEEVIEGEAAPEAKSKLDAMAEAIEPQQTDLEQAIEAKKPKPQEAPQIPVKTVEGDSTQADWKLFSNTFIQAVEDAPDDRYLDALVKKHEGALGNLKRTEEATHQYVMGSLESKRNEFRAQV